MSTFAALIDHRCPRYPRITFGPSPSSAAQAASFPGPAPVPDVLPEPDADA